MKGAGGCDYAEQLCTLLCLKWLLISLTFHPFRPQWPPLLHQTAGATSTTACVGGRTTPAPLSSGPCTATVSSPPTPPTHPPTQSCGNLRLIHCLLSGVTQSRFGGGAAFEFSAFDGLAGCGAASICKTMRLWSAYQISQNIYVSASISFLSCRALPRRDFFFFFLSCRGKREQMHLVYFVNFTGLRQDTAIYN